MSVCVSNDSHLLSYDKTYIAGYSCTSGVLFFFINVFAIGLQVLRNVMWTKSSQVQRLALKEEAYSEKRWGKTKTLLWYTLIQYLLYVVSFLLIVGGNLIVLFSVGLGNILGVYYSMRRQEADTPEQIEEEMVSMLNDYDDLSTKETLTAEQAREMAEMKRLRDELRKFLTNRSSSYKESQEPRASAFRSPRDLYRF